MRMLELMWYNNLLRFQLSESKASRGWYWLSADSGVLSAQAVSATPLQIDQMLNASRSGYRHNTRTLT